MVSCVINTECWSGLMGLSGCISKSGDEMMIYYNHRRDDFAGGLASGFTGYIGLDAELYIISKVKASFEFKYGSAIITGVQLSFML